MIEYAERIAESARAVVMPARGGNRRCVGAFDGAVIWVPSRGGWVVGGVVAGSAGDARVDHVGVSWNWR